MAGRNKGKMAGNSKLGFDSQESEKQEFDSRNKRRGSLKPIELQKLTAGMHADGNGLYLAVGESGSRSWILRTVVRGRRSEIGLGSLATTPLSKARDEAADLRRQARKGVDILAERRQKKLAEQRETSIPTFESAAREFHETLKPTFSSETHAYNWLQSLETYVFPIFGKKLVDKIESADIIQAIGPMWNDVPDTAGRTLRRVKKIFDYCTAQGHRTLTVNGITITLPNPCDTIRAALPRRNITSKHHEALDYKDLPEFISKLRVSNSALSVKLAFEFLILTCARTSEVREADWTEFDFNEDVWTVPSERMKMKVEHKVPLVDRAVEILNLAKEFNDSEIVFPGRYAGHPLSNMSFLMALRRMGYEGLTAHGFRATFKTWAEETTKFDSLVIEACMAHAVKGIERHYLRTTFFDQRKRLMEAWARFAIDSPTAKVVKMRS
jgi:integrase